MINAELQHFLKKMNFFKNTSVSSWLPINEPATRI